MLDALATSAAGRDGAPVLDVEGLSVSFRSAHGQLCAVRDFGCRIRRGEAMGLVGESGCGKSTVALAIMRDLPGAAVVTGGTVRLHGRDMAALSGEQLRQTRGKDVAMVYQEPMASLNPTLKIGRQLVEVLLTHESVGKAEAAERSLAMLEAVRLPDAARMMRRYPHQLSGGQQQRVVIAMALLSNPALLILDEPTTALDVTVEAGIVSLINDLRSQLGTATLFISHNLGLIKETCDRVTVMYAGEPVETGCVDDVFRNIRHPYTRGLVRSIPLATSDKETRPLVGIPGQLQPVTQDSVGCSFAPRCEHAQDSVCRTADIAMQSVAGRAAHFSRCARLEAIDWGAGREPHAARARAKPGAPVAQVAELKKYYGAQAGGIAGFGEFVPVRALESASFEVRECETLAIVGESGCGKSTIARVLLGLEVATDGAVTLQGERIEARPVQQRTQATVSAVQMVFQNPFDTLNPSYSVGDQIQRTLERFCPELAAAERRARMLDLLDMVKLPRAFAARMPGQLSGGQKQRVGIARAFAGNTRLVVADEPTSALDVSVQAAIIELLLSAQRDNGTAMIFISHDLSVVRYLADRVVVMYLGSIMEEGATAQIFAPPYHPYTEALLSAIPLLEDDARGGRIVLEGDTPSPMNPPSGCPFQTRCRYKAHVGGGRCESEFPPLRDLGEGHGIRCFLPAAMLAEMAPVFPQPEEAEEASRRSGAPRLNQP